AGVAQPQRRLVARGRSPAREEPGHRRAREGGVPPHPQPPTDRRGGEAERGAPRPCGHPGGRAARPALGPAEHPRVRHESLRKTVMTPHRYCDGIRRRDFLRVGALGAAGLGLTDYLRLAAAGEVKEAKATAAIFINLAGGPSHLDTFDSKPEAPEDYRGEFKTIPTNVPGVAVCEHLPRLARCADKFAVLRGVGHSLTEHQMGTKYINTGNRPIPSLEFPGYGAVVSKELGSPRDLPPFVAVPKTPQVPGILGVEYAAFNTQATPRAGLPFTVRGMTPGGLAGEKLERRHQLLADLDATFDPHEKDSGLLKGLDRFSQ